MSNVKEKIKAVTSMRLFLPIVCLIAVLLVNLITTPGFFKISINNGVLYGYVVDIVNRASELVILAVGMTLVTAASGGQDISVGAIMAVVVLYWRGYQRRRCDGGGSSSLLPDIIRWKGVGRCVGGTTCFRSCSCTVSLCIMWSFQWIFGSKA